MPPQNSNKAVLNIIELEHSLYDSLCAFHTVGITCGHNGPFSALWLSSVLVRCGLYAAHMFCTFPGSCIPHGGDGREYAGIFGQYGHKRDSVRKDEHEQCCTFFFMVLRCVHDSSLFILRLR